MCVMNLQKAEPNISTEAAVLHKEYSMRKNKMIFADHHLFINTEKQTVTELSSYVEVKEVLSGPNLESEFQILADMKAEDLFGAALFCSPWMKAEYINSGYTLTARYRLYGDSNDDPSAKIYDRVLLVTATPLLV